ncbi:MAG: ETC complex I subunit [Alphaproteobacteria bacterium]|nr:ETC complex I subunit [Alphaproteobacteria bacterium]
MDVRIYRPSKSAMQSGRAKAQDWILQYELRTSRAPGGVMRWTSSGDALNQVQLSFKSLEDAISYANKKGWNYTTQPEQERIIRPRNYVDNFKYIPLEETGNT